MKSGPHVKACVEPKFFVPSKIDRKFLFLGVGEWDHNVKFRFRDPKRHTAHACANRLFNVLSVKIGATALAVASCQNPNCVGLSCFVPKIQAVKIAVKLRSRRKKGWFGAPDFRGRVYPRFRTCIFKSHSRPSMVLVKFRLVSSRGG